MFTTVSLVMTGETEKHHLSASLELVLVGKAPVGHATGSDRENLDILANSGQDICRKIIPTEFGRGAGERQVKVQGPFSSLSQRIEKPRLLQ